MQQTPAQPRPTPAPGSAERPQALAASLPPATATAPPAARLIRAASLTERHEIVTADADAGGSSADNRGGSVAIMLAASPASEAAP